MALNAKQQRFVDEYLIDLCATQAAIRAGYSKRTANRIGSHLLSKVDIQQALVRAIAKRAEKTGLSADRVLEELQTIAYDDSRRDQIRALELLGKHLGLFTDRLEVEQHSTSFTLKIGNRKKGSDDE